jgi:hypothetical protein
LIPPPLLHEERPSISQGGGIKDPVSVKIIAGIETQNRLPGERDRFGKNVKPDVDRERMLHGGTNQQETWAHGRDPCRKACGEKGAFQKPPALFHKIPWHTK